MAAKRKSSGSNGLFNLVFACYNQYSNGLEYERQVNKMACPHGIVAGYVLPHPPIIVPGVSDKPHLAKDTVQSLQKVSSQLADLNPDTIVVISPHAPMFSDFLFFYQAASLEGSLAGFGAPQVKLNFKEDIELREKIIGLLDQAGIQAGGLSKSQMNRFGLETELDHGVIVPLFWAASKVKSQVIAMASSDLPTEQLYEIGKIIRQASVLTGRRVAIIASGDQSHKVNQASPYGSCPEGELYDQAVCRCFAAADLPGLLKIDSDVRRNAAECGYRSMIIMLGAFDRQPVRSTLLSYEAPYGIGYCAASVLPDQSQNQDLPGALELYKAEQREVIARERVNESFPVMVARKTLETEIAHHHRLHVNDFSGFSATEEKCFRERAGVFVSLKKDGDLRGCIGTVAPTTESIVAEIIQNAISAGLRDPRFSPVTLRELPDIKYSVDILGEPEPVRSRQELDPDRFGVIVRKGPRSGLLLPALDGVDSVGQQLEIACRKAGISHEEDYEIQKFGVERYT